MKIKFNKNRINRYAFVAAIFFLILFILSMIAYGIYSDRVYSKVYKHRNVREDTYQNIVNHLEYNGLDEEAMALMERFSKEYSEYANFIVIDSEFNIQYQLNRGFINDDGKFYVITDDSGRAFICDKEGTILSTHGLAVYNMDAIRKLTSKYFSMVGSPSSQESEFSTNGQPTVSIVTDSNYLSSSSVQFNNNGQTYYIDFDMSYSTNLRFHAIQSKNLNLCFIYDENDPLWNLRMDDAGRHSAISSTFGVMAGLSFFLYWLGLALFVFLDARRHDNHPALWGVLTLFTNIVGLVVYLAVRPERIYCSSCREPLAKNHSFCPICGTRNRAKCVGCGMVVQGEWAFCVNCGMGVADAPIVSETPIETEKASSND